MKDTTRRQAGQAGPVENARHAYAQIPLALLCLPTGERSAAIEVWAALHHHLRLGSRLERITDEELSTVPWLIERSVEHGRKGLEILERLGLIRREARGSSRRVAIAGRLQRKDNLTRQPQDRPLLNKRHEDNHGNNIRDTPAAGRAWEHWQLVRGN